MASGKDHGGHAFKTPPVVEIDWLDSYASHGWTGREERLKEDRKPSMCKTVGYLLERDREFIRVAESMTGNDCVGCTTSIPRFAVRSVRTLRK